MKLNKQFYILLITLIILCATLYFINNAVTLEGLTADKNQGAVAEAQRFENDDKYGNSSGYIKILPLSNSVSTSSNTTGIMANYPDITSLPISQYVVKSSYNSACSGESKNVSNEMLMYILSRGCRFIDFEISNISGIPYVVVSDPTGVVPIDKNKICKLDDILTTVVTYGLTSSDKGGAPNYGDPLFIHLRVNPDPGYNYLYQNIASSVYKNIGSRLYGFSNSGVQKVDINKHTVKNIMGNVVLIMCANYNSKWKEQSSCASSTSPCYDLSKFVHLESGTNVIKTIGPSALVNQKQTPILPLSSDSLSVESYNVAQIVLPNEDIGFGKNIPATNTNPDFKSLLTGWCCNFITNRFYISRETDSNIIAYENFFNAQKLAIVPLSYARTYFLKQ